MIVFLLLLIATAVVPRWIAIQRSRDLQEMEVRVARLPAEARDDAVDAQMPVRIRLADDSLVLEKVPPGDNPESLGQVKVGSGLQITGVQQGGRAADPESWQWIVYPDGSAEDGGIQFSAGMRSQALVLFSDGSALWVTGDLSDRPPTRWPAGEAALRGG